MTAELVCIFLALILSIYPIENVTFQNHEVNLGRTEHHEVKGEVQLLF